MKLIIRLYYLFYVLSGGFRHFGVDFLFFKYMNGEIITKIPTVFAFLESSFVLYGFFILFFPLKKVHHFIFGLLLFLVDLYFQNNINFVSSLILPHTFPLFIYFGLLYKNNRQNMNYLTYISILFVGTGYLTSCFGKLNSGWLVRDNLVIYGYILDFNKGIGLPTLMGDMLLTFKNKVFWKAIDYSVLIFQFSYLLVFYDKRFFFYLTPLSILFHIGILFTLGMGVFYLYILFYALIYIWISPSVLSNKQGFLKQNILSTKVFKGIVMGVLMLLFILSGFDAHFFNQLLPLEIYQYN